MKTGKQVQDLLPLLLPFGPDRFCNVSLFASPIFDCIACALHPIFLLPYFAAFYTATQGMLCIEPIATLLKISVNWPAIHSFGKYGGERGIRTLDAFFKTYTISNRALSTTQTSLQNAELFLTRFLNWSGCWTTRTATSATFIIESLTRSTNCFTRSCCNIATTTRTASTTFFFFATNFNET